MEDEKRKILNGFVLFENKECDFEKIIKNFKGDWNIEVKEKFENSILIFNVYDMRVALSFIPAPVPEKEAELNAENNFFWENGAEKTAKHQAQMITAVFGNNPVKTAELFVKICSSILKLENVIGVYLFPNVMPKEQFLSGTQFLIDEKTLPLQNIVYIGLCRSKKGFCGYTKGLSFFEKKEIEVINSKKEPFEIYDFLFDIIYYVVENDVELKDGETIGFSEEQKLPITVSKGIYVEDETIKIKF